jgi:hypothetical protein
MVGAASGGGGRQLRVWGGCSRRRGARGVVESVGEMLERAVDGGTVGGEKWRRKKGYSTVGVAPFTAARGSGRPRRGNGGWENDGGKAVGADKAAVAVV